MDNVDHSVLQPDWMIRCRCQWGTDGEGGGSSGVLAGNKRNEGEGMTHDSDQVPIRVWQHHVAARLILQPTLVPSSCVHPTYNLETCLTEPSC